MTNNTEPNAELTSNFVESFITEGRGGIPSPPPSPGANVPVNFFAPQNPKGGSTRKKTGGKTNADIVKDIKTLVEIHNAKWNNLVDISDLESEALWWAWDKLEHLASIANKSETSYYKYINNSIKRLLDRFSQDELVKYNEEQAHLYREIRNDFLTTDIVISKLKAKDPKMIYLVKKASTEKQWNAAEAVYVLGLSHKEAAEMYYQGLSSIYFNADRAIKNTITKNTYWETF